MPLPGKRKDSTATRQTSARLLEAIQPLADALHPPVPPLTAPAVVCAPESLDPAPYLRILRWFLADGETLHVLALPDQPDAGDPLSSILNGAMGKLAAVRDKAPTRTLVAVTDRRILTALTTTFLEQGAIGQEIPLDQVRYVRTGIGPDKNTRSSLDLVTRAENIRWHFPRDIADDRVHELAAVLAASMTIPDAEREQLRRRSHPALEADIKTNPSGTASAAPIGATG